MTEASILEQRGLIVVCRWKNYPGFLGGVGALRHGSYRRKTFSGFLAPQHGPWSFSQRGSGGGGYGSVGRWKGLCRLDLHLRWRLWWRQQVCPDGYVRGNRGYIHGSGHGHPPPHPLTAAPCPPGGLWAVVSSGSSVISAGGWDGKHE